MRNLKLIITALCFFAATACSKKNEQSPDIDVRYRMYNKYCGFSTLVLKYTQAVPTIALSDSTFSSSLMVNVKEDLSANDAAIITEESNVAGQSDIDIRVRGVNKTSDGAGFIIPLQTFTANNLSYTLEGNNKFPTPASAFDGRHIDLSSQGSGIRTYELVLTFRYSVSGIKQIVINNITYYVPYEYTFVGS